MPKSQLFTRSSICARDLAFLIAATVLILFLLSHGRASADDAACANTANKWAAKVAKVQASNSAKCIKDSGKNKLSGTIEECLSSDPKGKVGKAAGKLNAKVGEDCAGNPALPPIDVSDPNALSEIMIERELVLIHAVFSSDLDAPGLVVLKDDDKDGWKCQSAIAKAVGKCGDAKLASYNSCKADQLAGGVATAEELQSTCLGTGGDGIPDPAGKIAKKCVTGLAKTASKKCALPYVDDLIPGCAGAVNLAGCLDQKVGCEVCKALNALDGLARNCDGFDDGVSNGSCTSPDPFDTWYGNGSFGTWINDEFGLPAYSYTGCSGGTCTDANDAFHQLGNDDISAVAHSDGYVELFTVKTYYRYANKYDEAAGNYAGGFGWVRDGSETWSTLYDDRPVSSSYERVFGMGYYKKEIQYGELRIEQYVYPPAGGDEVLLEKLVFTNLSGSEKSLRYFDYWDVAWWLVLASGPYASESDYDPAKVKTYYDAARATIKAVSQAAEGDYEQPSLTQDPSPKVSFVTWLDDVPDAFDTVQTAFLGSGNRALPERVGLGQLSNSLDASGTLNGEAAVLVTQKDFTLGPGESRALHVLYGLSRRGDENDLIDAYRAGPPYTLPDVMASWAQRVLQIELSEDAWIAREMAWSHYYLLAGMLREDYFETRVTNQGGIYQYWWGVNAGPRAALRHLVPLIYTDPEVAREVLIYYLRAMEPSGELCYATAGYGAWHPMGFEPSDHSLWLLWTAAEYVNATRDYDFLDESFDYYCDAGRGACGSATAYEMLKSAYAYQVGVVGTGTNGLIRLMDSDWDDNLTSGSFGVDPNETAANGESTMNTALALVAYPRLAALAEKRGDAAFAASVRQAADDLTTAMTAQWRGEFFNRAYVYTGPGSPVEVGTDNVWLASNGPALLAEGLMTSTQVEQLVSRIKSDCSDPSPIGLASQGVPVAVGVGTPGLWYSLSGPTIEGLVRHPLVDGARELAWTEFKKQTFANHAAQYPDYWYGIWSGPDMYFTPVEGIPGVLDPGGTWCGPLLCMQDFPIANMFSHSEPLLASVRMAGVFVDETGHTIDPGIPFSVFRWESEVYAVEYTPLAATGRIRPVGSDTIEMRVRLPASLDPGDASVSVGGASVPFEVIDGFAEFELPLQAGSSSSWSLH